MESSGSAIRDDVGVDGIEAKDSIVLPRDRDCQDRGMGKHGFPAVGRRQLDRRYPIDLGIERSPNRTISWATDSNFGSATNR